MKRKQISRIPPFQKKHNENITYDNGINHWSEKELPSEYAEMGISAQKPLIRYNKPVDQERELRIIRKDSEFWPELEMLFWIQIQDGFFLF